MPSDRMAVDEQLMKAFGDLRSVADDIRYGRHTATVLAASVRAIAEEVRTAARDAPALRDAGTGRDSGEAMREAVEAALTDWSRPSAIRLMIGETVTRQEGRTANAVAAMLAAKIRAAINSAGLSALADSSGGEKP